MTGSNPIGRGKLDTKRHILTDKEGFLLSVVMSSASMHDVKLVTDVVDSAVAKRRIPYAKTKEGRKGKLQHLFLDKACNSKPEEQAIAKRGCVIHLPHKEKRRDQERKRKNLKSQEIPCKKMGCEENQFMAQQVRKLFTRYEKKMENYLGLVQFSCCIIIYRKIVLG